MRQKIGLIVFGFFIGTILLELGLRMGGLVLSSFQEYRNFRSIRQKGHYRILCLGESTTALGGEDSFPSQLEMILNQMHTGIRVSVINEGRAGTNTALILSELEHNLDRYSPDMVVTMMGINDENDEYSASYDTTGFWRMSFLGSSRVYKLIQYIIMHMRSNFRALCLYGAPKGVIYERNEFFPSQLYVPSLVTDQEKMLERRASLNPGAYQTYMEFKAYRMRRGQNDTETNLKRFINSNPHNVWGYLALGWCYWYQGKTSSAEEMARKAATIDPKNEWIYLEMGSWLTNTRNFARIEDLYRRAIDINPDNAWSYAGMGWSYKIQKQYDSAGEMFKKAIGLDPGNVKFYCLLGSCHTAQKRYEDAADVIKKAIHIDAHSIWPYTELARCYWVQKRFREAENLLKGAIVQCEESDVLYGILARCYWDQGNRTLAEEYHRKAEKARMHTYNPITRQNYQKLKDIVTSRGIKLVCVQYPMRSIDSLKNMFASTEGILFVENRRAFEDALRLGRYDDYFQDVFGGDFGHCTRKGNRLLAENVAQIIAKECFNLHENIAR